MNRDEAISRARKLLRLGESTNKHEASTAMAQAQKILDEYEINQAMLDDDDEDYQEDNEEVEDFGDKEAYLDSASQFNFNRWRSRLGYVLSETNQCRTYTTTDNDERGRTIKALSIVGRPSDVEKVRYLYQYFVKEVTRLCNRDGKGCGNNWRNEYKKGVVDTLSDMLEASREETIREFKAGKNAKALVKVDKALEKMEQRLQKVDDWTKENLKLRNQPRVYNQWNPKARALGQKAGKEIKLTKAKGALESGS